ncbi:MAG: hypothetical protein QNJ70_20690 [Xenococcaceae cyanobacterium MO_207.B15]|nr:hypothetical protein [Xenococcaceae cyanobacterium MO_207.B15]
MTKNNSNSDNFFTDSAKQFAEWVNKLDRCPHCQHILTNVYMPVKNSTKYQEVMRCYHCDSFWDIIDSKLINITEIIDIEAEDARNELLKQHLKKLSQTAKRHLN